MLPNRLGSWKPANASYRLYDVAAGVVCACALAHAVSVTTGVLWPSDPDQFRDLAQAQTMLEGWLRGDPYYLGETFWYNPLTAALLAVLSLISGTAPHTVHVAIGPFVNLVAPIALYVFMAIAVSRVAAFMSLIAFLGFDYSLAYISASYSPWLFPATVGQGLFFVSIGVLASFLKREERPPFVLSGVLIGIVFLTHTAPALLLGGLVTVVELWHCGWRGVHRAAARVTLTALVAAAVASPFIWSLVIRYRLHVVNPHPSIWQEPMLELSQFGDFIYDHLGQWMMVPVGVGVIWIASRRRGKAERLIGVWMCLACVGLAYAYLYQYLRTIGIAAEPILPGFHFFRYVKLAEVVLFGCGAAVVIRAVARFIQRRLSAPHATLLEGVITALAAALIIDSVYPKVIAKPDATVVRQASLRMFTGPDQRELYDWIRTQRERSAVFAAPTNTGMAIVGPAGGRVLATDPFFANPYVPWQPRVAARDALMQALANEDCLVAGRVAANHDVRFVVAPKSAIRSGSPCGVPPVFEGSEWRIFRLPEWFRDPGR